MAGQAGGVCWMRVTVMTAECEVRLKKERQKTSVGLLEVKAQRIRNDNGTFIVDGKAWRAEDAQRA